MKLKLTIDGKTYEVDVEVSEPEQPHPTYVPPLGHARPAAPVPVAPAPAPGGVGNVEVADESKVCRSPLAGTVARISTQVGQTIQVNDVLMVLEAMKMETAITAPFNGKISKIHVQTGEAVQQGQVLIEIE